MKKVQELEKLNQLDKKGLMKELQDTQRSLTRFRIDQSMGKLKNYHEISHARKKIARIWTILGEKLEKDNLVKEQK